MAIQIRLDFPTFCSYYSNNEMSVHKERGKKNELAFKHTIHGQLTRVGQIRAFPLTISFEFMSVKEYPLSNYFLLAQWTLDVFKFHGVLQDINPMVVAEITVRAKTTRKHDRQGCLITIERYKNVPA